MGTCHVRKAPTLDSAAWKKLHNKAWQPDPSNTAGLQFPRLRPPLPGLNQEVANGEILQRMVP